VRAGSAELVEPALDSIEAASEVVPISREAAASAAGLLADLRRSDPSASLADALMLATARERGVRLVSNDAAFAGLKDVVRA
jgi:predicted nucleic acid-binding protein